MGALFSIDRPVLLRDGNDYKRSTQQISRSVQRLRSEFVLLPFIALWGTIKLHIINSKRMEMSLYFAGFAAEFEHPT
jgi:hypothetical protein